MAMLRKLGDDLLGLFVPRVRASALWYWQSRCVTAYCVITDASGNLVTGNRQYLQRHCHDGSGYCTAWEIARCDC